MGSTASWNQFCIEPGRAGRRGKEEFVPSQRSGDVPSHRQRIIQRRRGGQMRPARAGWGPLILQGEGVRSSAAVRSTVPATVTGQARVLPQISIEGGRESWAVEAGATEPQCTKHPPWLPPSCTVLLHHAEHYVRCMRRTTVCFMGPGTEQKQTGQNRPELNALSPRPADHMLCGVTSAELQLVAWRGPVA